VDIMVVSDALNYNKCVYMLSPTSSIYWVELGFINNCKKPQLQLN
jgi:hypothetical protein